MLNFTSLEEAKKYRDHLNDCMKIFKPKTKYTWCIAEWHDKIIIAMLFVALNYDMSIYVK